MADDTLRAVVGGPKGVYREHAGSGSTGERGIAETFPSHTVVIVVASAISKRGQSALVLGASCRIKMTFMREHHN